MVMSSGLVDQRGNPIGPPGAVPKPTPQQEAALVLQAAQQGRQSRDVPLLAGRRLFGGVGAMALGYSRDLRYDDISIETLDQIRKDDTIAAALKLLKSPILGRINKATVLCDDPAVKRVIEYTFLESGILSQLATTSFRGLDFGVAFHEIEWEASPLDVTYTETDPATAQETELQAWQGPGLWPKAFREVNPQTIREIRRDPNDHAYNGFVQRGWPEVTVEAVNSFVYTPDQEFGNMWGKPKIRDAYPYWLWKHATIKSWMQWAEAKADPARKAFYPKGKTESGADNGQVALDAALALSNQTAVALPSEALSDAGTGSLRAWDIVEIATTDRTDIFEKTVNYFNSAMLRSMFVPERAFGVIRETGTYSETKAHIDTFMLSQEAGELHWLGDVNHYAVARVVELNFGPDAAKATITMPGLTDEERDFVRETFQKLLGATDPTLGGVVDMRELAENEGLPVTDAPPVAPQAGQPLPAPPLPSDATADPTGGASGWDTGGVAPQLSDGATADHGHSSLPDDAEVARIEQRAKALAARFLKKAEHAAE